MNEPKSITAGDTCKWTESFSDYPATTYTLTYTLSGKEVYTVTATASGTDYAITISTTDSDLFIPGIYQLIGSVAKSGERYTVSTGTVEILANPAEMKAGTGFLSHARTVLGQIETAIETLSIHPIDEITIAGRTLKRPKLDELVKLRAKYIGYVRAEEQKERIAKGLGGSNRILTRFSPIS
jgi:hypothetical protein